MKRFVAKLAFTLHAILLLIFDLHPNWNNGFAQVQI